MPTADLYITTLPVDQIKSLALFDFGSNKSIGVTGFYKTILQWLKCFMTEQGSFLDDPTYGTTFGGMYGQFINDPSTFRDIIAFSMTDATTTIKKYQSEWQIPADEKLNSVVLTNLTLTTTTADVYFTLTNVAGTRIRIVLPVGVRPPTPSP